MKLAIQTIKSVIKELEVTPETTVDELREQIRLMYNWPVGSKIILVHKTKILNQTTTKLVEIPTIKDGDRIVVMKKSEPSQPAQTAPPAQPEPVAAATVTAATSQPAPAAAPPAVPTTHMYYNDGQITQLQGMGFEAATARRALIAAFGNTDRAVEYLISGNIPNIVDNDPQEATTTGAAAANPTAPANSTTQQPTPQTLANNTGGLQTEAFGRVTQPGAAAAAAAPAGAAPGMNPNDLDSQLGQLAASSPNYLPQILQALGEQNPALLTMIEQNPRMFSQVLASLAAGEMQEGGGAAGQMPMPPAVTVQLTQAEADAVNRLCELGFSKENALQAYLACDKNEELAANFLFDNADMDE